jgi:hypothetical protein
MNTLEYKVTLFFIVLSTQLIFADNTTTGLYFYSYEVNKENRTSLHIPVAGAISLSDGFAMEFEMKIRDEKQNFGYAFRLVGDNKTNIDMVIFDWRVSDDIRLLSLIVEDRIILQFEKEDIPNFQFNT